MDIVHYIKRFGGHAMILSGVVILLLCLLTDLKNNNTALFLGLIFILAGIILYVRLYKSRGPY